jgi:hypothetical protein
MVSIVKWVTVVWLSIMVVASEGSSDGLKKDQARVCVRWQWVQTALEQKVNCVEWAIKDCSNRLYPEICKRGG